MTKDGYYNNYYEVLQQLLSLNNYFYEFLKLTFRFYEISDVVIDANVPVNGRNGKCLKNKKKKFW